MTTTRIVGTYRPGRGSALLLLALSMVIFTVSAASDPGTVVMAGSFQDELGCPGDWQPDCALTGLVYDATDDVWQGVLDVPAGSWEYKAALNGSWTENYGAGAQSNGPNIQFLLSTPAFVKFYYDHKTHWVTDNRSSLIAVAPGSFQSELGCPGDWDPGCLRSWLQDPDGDGIFSFTAVLPAGTYETKVAIGESWDLNYGAGGVPNGPNIPFTVPRDCDEMLFAYNPVTHVLTISPAPRPNPASVTIAGSLQDELGCPGDWQPDCALTGLAYDATDDVWQGVLDVPAGSWEYKAALNGSWTENYGAGAQLNGPNIQFLLSTPAFVKFYYDHKTHWVTDNRTSSIAVAPGSFQSELGCPGDWDPGCLRSWLQDPDGDGIFSFTAVLPAGTYETKVAIGESWDLNYGAGGVPNGANIPFTVGSCCAPTLFQYSAATHVLTVTSQTQPTTAVVIETSTNGEDADTPPGPSILVGSVVLWTYVVTNAGDTTLEGVTVVDDRGVSVSCPATTLEPGESMTCTASGVAAEGQYANIGTATGYPPGASSSVADSDPSHYLGVAPLPFTGFFPPVSDSPAVNRVRAGSMVPVKFSLGADRGLAIFAPGFPLLLPYQCVAGSALDPVPPVAGHLEYDASAGRYTYLWKTTRGHAGCAELVLRFFDGTQASALFDLR